MVDPLPGARRPVDAGPRPPTITKPRGLAVLLFGVAIVSLALIPTLVRRPRPILLWNASASSPTGLYAVFSSTRVRLGDTAVAWAPPQARRLAAARNYLPANVPLVKSVAAVRGDRVCAKRRIIFVNGRAAALRRARDPAGRPMPSWSGCRMLRRGELFLLSPNAPEAFDGRYFGVTRPGDVIGKAKLLWPG